MKAASARLSQCFLNVGAYYALVVITEALIDSVMHATRRSRHTVIWILTKPKSVRRCSTTGVDSITIISMKRSFSFPYRKLHGVDFSLSLQMKSVIDSAALALSHVLKFQAVNS